MNSQEQALEEKMEVRLAEYSKIRKKVPKDGACMFRCIAEEMYGSQTFHRLLREQCVKYMRTNSETFLPFVVGCSDLPWDHYLFELQKVETWGGYLELMALSKMLKVNFTIYTETAAPTIVDQGFPSGVSLAFSGGNHYDLVRNKDKIGVYSYCQELVYNIVQQISCPGQTLDSEKQEYKNIAYECWIEDLKKQESRDKLITKKLLESPQQYTGLTGYYKKDSSPTMQAKEPPKNKKHRNKKANKPQANVHAPLPVSPPPSTPAPQLSAEELELQSILSQIEEVEKKQLHHISFNKDFPEFKPKTKPPASAPPDSPQNSTAPASLDSTILSPSIQPSTTASTTTSSTTPSAAAPSAAAPSAAAPSAAAPSATAPSATVSSPASSSTPSSETPSSTTPAPAPTNAWKTPKAWSSEQKK